MNKILVFLTVAFSALHAFGPSSHAATVVAASAAYDDVAAAGRYGTVAAKLNVGDLVRISSADTLPSYLDKKLLQYYGMVGIIVDKGTPLTVLARSSSSTDESGDCWVVQLDDNSEVEIPAVCLKIE